MKKITLWEVVTNDCFELPIGVYPYYGKALAYKPRGNKYKIVKVEYRSKEEYEKCDKY